MIKPLGWCRCLEPENRSTLMLYGDEDGVYRYDLERHVSQQLLKAKNVLSLDYSFDENKFCYVSHTATSLLYTQQPYVPVQQPFCLVPINHVCQSINLSAQYQSTIQVYRPV